MVDIDKAEIDLPHTFVTEPRYHELSQLTVSSLRCRAFGLRVGTRYDRTRSPFTHTIITVIPDQSHPFTVNHSIFRQITTICFNYLLPCYLRPTLRSPSSTVRLLPTHSYCESACDSMQTAILIHHFCPSVCLSVRHVVVRCLYIRMQKITVWYGHHSIVFFQPHSRQHGR